MTTSKVRLEQPVLVRTPLRVLPYCGEFGGRVAPGVTKAKKGRKKLQKHLGTNIWNFFLNKMTCGNRSGDGNLVRGNLREGGLV